MPDDARPDELDAADTTIDRSLHAWGRWAQPPAGPLPASFAAAVARRGRAVRARRAWFALAAAACVVLVGGVAWRIVIGGAGVPSPSPGPGPELAVRAEPSPTAIALTIANRQADPQSLQLPESRPASIGPSRSWQPDLVRAGDRFDPAVARDLSNP
ncbi:MAG: hypothetical protein JNJ48_00355 [Phycisphaerae bacterium]|nr:hypothetical protein [Phycisphaerae bacterium]